MIAPEMDFAQVHDAVFQFLDQKHAEDASIQFTVRGAKAEERLSQGYWFNGNDKSLYFSLWTGSDFVNKTPNIFIEVADSGQVRLCLSSKDNPDLATILNVLATALDMKPLRLNGVAQNFWAKTYQVQADTSNKPCIAALELFFQQDVSKIDPLLFALQAAVREDLRILRWKSEPDYEGAIRHIAGLRSTPLLRNTGNVKQPIVLQSLYLKNIGHFADSHMNFSFDGQKKGIICIVGENGTGKTTLLRAIALGLLGVESLPPDALKTLVSYANLTEQAEEAEITVRYQMDKACRNTITFQKSGKLSNDGEKVIDILNDDTADFASVLDGEKFNGSLVIGLSQTVTNENKMAFKDRELAPNKSDVVNLIFNEPESRLGFIEAWANETSNTNPKLVEKLFMQINKIVHDVTGENFILYLRREKLAYTLNGQELQASLMSQGYTNLIGWIGKLAIRFAEVQPTFKHVFQYPAIVLIDEIDTYLHPKWQRQMLPALAKRMTQTYFVVTTHSPYVLQAIPGTGAGRIPLAVFQVKKNGEELAINQLQEPSLYGFDLNRLSADEDIFATPERVAQISYDAIRQYISAGTAESVASAEQIATELLQNGISEREPELMRLRQALKTRKLLLAKKVGA